MKKNEKIILGIGAIGIIGLIVYMATKNNNRSSVTAEGSGQQLPAGRGTIFSDVLDSLKKIISPDKVPVMQQGQVSANSGSTASGASPAADMPYISPVAPSLNFSTDGN